MTVEFGPHTAFIGGNGAGKSSILRAIEKFYSTARNLDADDYFGRDQANAVEIELTFKDLSAAETEAFESRVRNNELVIRRVFDGSPTSGRYHGLVLQNPDFGVIRSHTTAKPKTDAYRELRNNNPLYQGLPTATSAKAVDENLLAWEKDHQEGQVLALDDGQFIGFQNASRGALQRYTSFVFIPAVREAMLDAADGKASVIGRLIEIVVRSAILKRPEFAEFKAAMAARYKEIVSAEKMPELDALGVTLTTDLRGLYEEAKVDLTWRDIGDLPIPLPAADVVLSDDGFGGPVDRQGHGLQRALILTLLQHLARASTIAGAEEPADADAALQAPNLILAVEEPELYQHPTKQRHFARVLRALSEAMLPGAGGRTQVAFASHSPMFVTLAHSDEIRLVRREACEGSEFKHCVLSALDLEAVAKDLEVAWEKPPGSYSGASLQPRLHILGTELAEGFFAKGVVLVEGRSDRAALAATARTMDIDFEALGIAVLPVEGKGNLDRPMMIFRAMGIPTYAIWDCDAGSSDPKPHMNLALCRACRPGDVFAEAPTADFVGSEFAHFGSTLEGTLKKELSPEVYDECLKAACEPLELTPNKDAQKMPAVMYTLLTSAYAQGGSSPTLEAVVTAIMAHLQPPTSEGDGALTVGEHGALDAD